MVAFPSPDFFAEALQQPLSSISYSVHRHLTEKSQRCVIHCKDHFFDVQAFADAGRCQLALSSKIFSEVLHEWEPLHQGCTIGCGQYYNRDTGVAIARRDNDALVEDSDQLKPAPKIAWFHVTWQPNASDSAPLQLELVHMSVFIPSTGCDKRFSYVLADTHEIASQFIVAVQKFVSEIRNRIWVFESGEWRASLEMYEAVKSVTFDKLVLTPEKGAAIRTDMELFFRSRELYQQCGLPWKRGYLFTGPPGNGKTHLIKALINHITDLHPGVRPLYVKTFRDRWESDEEGISSVFKRARQAPCILVLEDLDTLVTKSNRAFFLNEMDGFHSNHGIVVIATTNHPDKLDPALRDRPSRFDRRFQFALPSAEERAMWLRMWNRAAPQAHLRLSEAEVAAVAAEEVTGGFSFAYLKELLVSSTMLWLQRAAGLEGGDLLMIGTNGADGNTATADGTAATVNRTAATANGTAATADGTAATANGTAAAVAPNGTAATAAAALNGVAVAANGTAAAAPPNGVAAAAASGGKANGSATNGAAAGAAADGLGSAGSATAATATTFAGMALHQASVLKQYVKAEKEALAKAGKSKKKRGDEDSDSDDE